MRIHAMKIYIMTDMEGLCGVCDESYIAEDGPFHADARRYLMAELNAAIAGAFDGGASEVVARDGHYRGCNFITEQLDERATYESPHFGTWWGSMDESYGATFIVGAHAMAGTQNAFLDHTMDPASIFEYRCNGVEMGEQGMWAVGCGSFGVPLVLVTGDEAACAEARKLAPGCRTVAVKQAVCRSRARTYPLAEVLAKVRSAAAAAVRHAAEIPPVKMAPPFVCQQTWYRTEHADAAEKAGCERLDGRTCRKTVARATEITM
jgi:D-amino peptidase